MIAWTMFALILAVICVLSFQSGNATKAFEKPFVESVAGSAGRQLSGETVLAITYYIRQVGRGVLFLVLGFSGTCGVLICFDRGNRPALGIMVCMLLFAISYFTEKMKIFIEGRHYTFAECMEGFAFAVLGYILAAIILAIWRRRTGADR